MLKKESSITNLTQRTTSTDTTFLTQLDSNSLASVNNSSSSSSTSNSSTSGTEQTQILSSSRANQQQSLQSTVSEKQQLNFSLNSSFDDSNTNTTRSFLNLTTASTNTKPINEAEMSEKDAEKEALLLKPVTRNDTSSSSSTTSKKPEEEPSLVETKPALIITMTNKEESNKRSGGGCVSADSNMLVSNWQRRVLSCFEDIRCFTFFMCLVVMLTNALGVGYRNSVVTTIEKRYEFSSVFSGVLSGCLEVGSLITTLFVSYFCARSHIPKCIAVSLVCCAIGSLLYALPHLLSDSYTINNKVMNKTNNDMLCKYSSSHLLTNHNSDGSSISSRNVIISNGSVQVHAAQHLNGESSAVITFLNSLDIMNARCLIKPSNLGHFVIFVLANVLIGSSSAPLYTLGTAYIDTHVIKENSSIYLAFMYSMLAFGPVVGYLCGAAILQIYVDSFRYNTKDLNIGPEDSDWIGAWFLGFIVFGALIFFTSFSFLCFPKVIVKNRKQVENEQNNEMLNGSFLDRDKEQAKEEINENTFGNLKSMPQAIKNIVSNKVFMIVTLAYCFEINIISGFMTFLPKYIEHQFSVGHSMANIYTGLCAIPGACVGIVAGGFLVKKLKINPKGASIMAIACCILCLIGIVCLIFLGCPNINMAGTTTSYKSFNKEKLSLNLKKVDVDEINLISNCNKDCQCSTSYIEPICGKNGITYFSPCYAGCKGSKLEETAGISQDKRKKHSYTSCSCIENDLQNNSTLAHSDNSLHSVADAESGLCSFNCAALIPFLVMLFFITLLTALNQMPMLMVTLRSVKEIERPFALGVQLVIMRLLAYIPSPLVFGKAIDLTCLVWRRDECDQVGSCLFYDRERFRQIYGSIAAFYKVVSLFLFVLLFLVARKYNFNQQHSKQHEASSVLKDTHSNSNK